jgi:hypothetical protein
MSAKRTRFRCAPLNAPERAQHPMRRVGPRSRCAQSGLPHCPTPYLIPLQASRECQNPTVVYVNESDKYLIAFQYFDHNQIGIGQRMGEVVSDVVRAMECLSCVCDGFALFIQFMSGEVHVPHVVEGEALLRFSFGVGVRAEGGDRTRPREQRHTSTEVVQLLYHSVAAHSALRLSQLLKWGIGEPAMPLVAVTPQLYVVPQVFIDLFVSNALVSSPTSYPRGGRIVALIVGRVQRFLSPHCPIQAIVSHDSHRSTIMIY